LTFGIDAVHPGFYRQLHTCFIKPVGKTIIRGDIRVIFVQLDVIFLERLPEIFSNNLSIPDFFINNGSRLGFIQGI